MANISSVLNTGLSALFGSQVGIQVTSDNISNVDTSGYSRQVVDYADSIYTNSGLVGTGVTVASIARIFDKFIEAQYNNTASQSSMYSELYSSLSTVESLFTESADSSTSSSATGISSALNSFLNSWETLSTDPSSASDQQAVVDKATTLVGLLNQASSSLSSIQSSLDVSIQQGVTDVNNLSKQIADINKQISTLDNSVGTTGNALYDTRATLVRQLSALMDISYVDNGGGNFTVFTGSGQTLVDGSSNFEIKYEGPSTTSALTAGSTFDGQAYFSGSDDYEYTIKVIRGGVVSNASSANVAEYEVSLDGGKTWLTNSNGSPAVFYARPYSGKETVGDLNIWFGSASNSGSAPLNNLTAGDTFTITPKSALYWYNPAATDRENITPQSYSDGTLNDHRLTGGTLAADFLARDSYIGSYKDMLDSLSSSLVWEVNRIHSQGAGSALFSTDTGTYSVSKDNTALGSNSTGLAYGSLLSSGSASIFFFSTATGELASSASMGYLIKNFNPNTDSLDSLASSINSNWGNFVDAEVVNHKLSLTAKSGYSFAYGTDTTGLYAALGLNTFFSGSNASDISVNSLVGNNTAYLNAGHVDGSGGLASGDNTTALNIASLSTKDVTIHNANGSTSTCTLSEYYSTLVSKVGSDTSEAKVNYTYQSTLADDLNSRQQEVSGVNLDEEMSNLIKYQHAYQAAAKIISTADQMMQTLLGLKS